MSSTTLPSYEEAVAEAKRLASQPISKEEKIRYAEGAIAALEDDERVKEFENNIKEIGTTALQIDQAFDRVNRGFKEMVDKHGKDFPEVASYKREWEGYKERWVKYLWASRDVASKTSAVLKRYDQVFLYMIDNIQSDSDRKETIRELKSFSEERHEEAGKMADNFKGLEQDVKSFGARFETYLQQKKVQLEQAAERLKSDMEKLEGEIKDWNAQIAAGLLAMGASLAIGFWALIITGTAVAAFIIARILAQKKLNAKKAELAEVNRKQRALAELQTTFDGLKPDIALICEKLIIFGKIWDFVSSQSKEFGEHLERGMEAVNDKEFRLQVKLARKTCTPLRIGLAKYATEIDNSHLPKP